MLLEPEQRAKLIERIKDKIEYKIYYTPLKSGLINTDWVYSRILCIPSYPDVNESEVVRLCLG
jgi:dTDP-4-amino-4,6-dideoxygalactose transaminase